MTGRIWPHPPSRAITKRRMQCQPYGRDHPNLGDSFWSASTSTRGGDVRRSRDKTIGHGPNRTPSRNKTIRPRPRARSLTLRQRPLNRETRGDRLSDRPILPTIPLPTAHHPNHPIERSDHDSQTSTEENDARIDDEPLHREAHRARASATTMRKPVLRAYTARVVERPQKRDAVA